MPQRPSGLSRVARTRKPAPIPPEPRPGPGNGLSWTGRTGWIGHAAAHENRPGAETPTPTPAPTGGESLPDTSGGRACQRCGAYVVLPEAHADFHRNLDRHIRLTLDVFQVRGYITKGGDTATDGEGERDAR